MKPQPSNAVPPTQGGAFHSARNALNWIDQSTKYLVISAMVLMTTLVVGQVIFRYVFSSAIDWAEEVARLAFVWAMFLAIPHGIRRAVHVGIDALVVRLSHALQEKIFRAMAIISAALMVIIFGFAWQVTLYTWPEMMPTLQLTAAVYYIAILIAAVHSVLHLVLLAWGGRDTWEGMTKS